jgi:hypothetical protein
VGLKDTDLLERLDNVALDTGGRVAVVAGADTTTVLGAVELGEGANTDVLAEVDVTGNGRYEGSVESSRRPQFREERRGRAGAILPRSVLAGFASTHRRGRSTSRGRKEQAPSGNRS